MKEIVELELIVISFLKQLIKRFIENTRFVEKIEIAVNITIEEFRDILIEVYEIIIAMFEAMRELVRL